MSQYPAAIVAAGHVEPAPRRVRAMLDGVVVVDTQRASYVWEWPFYPQYYVPVADFCPGVLIDEDRDVDTPLGLARGYGLEAGGQRRPASVAVHSAGDLAGLARIEWDAPDAWFEEDEQIYVHPRSPYVRVDAQRSNRSVRIELDGLVLAEASSSVMVFETGLPTRHYLDRTAVDFTHLVSSDTETPCPYKGRTSAYWSVLGGRPDVAWSYDYPAAGLAAISGLVAFYDEAVDVFLDGVLRERPVTHFLE